MSNDTLAQTRTGLKSTLRDYFDHLGKTLPDNVEVNGGRNPSTSTNLLTATGQTAA